MQIILCHDFEELLWKGSQSEISMITYGPIIYKLLSRLSACEIYRHAYPKIQPLFDNDMKRVIETRTLAFVLQSIINSMSRKHVQTLIYPKLKETIETDVEKYYQLETCGPVIQSLINKINEDQVMDEFLEPILPIINDVELLYSAVISNCHQCRRSPRWDFLYLL